MEHLYQGIKLWPKALVSEWAWDATPHTMQKIPLQDYFACCPGLRGPGPPLRLPPLSTPSPPSASLPAPARHWGSRCVTDVRKEGRAGSPPPEVGWTWGREWLSWVWVGKVEEEGRQLGKPWGRRRMGCPWWGAQGWQRRVGAGIRRSGRTRWAAAAREGWVRQEGSRLPQSGRSTQRRQHGLRGTRSDEGNEGGARGRWSGDYDTALKSNRGRWKQREEEEMRERKGNERWDIFTGQKKIN